MRRVVVVGTTGSGKSTLSRELAVTLNLAYVELDGLHWGPKWRQSSDDEFVARVDEALRADGWVVDGNYSKARHIVWRRADTVVWLDYPLPVVMWRLLKRTLRRGLLREELWNGNRENVWEHLIPSRSLFVWALRTHGKHRREYPAQFSQPEYRHLRSIHLRSPVELDRWLQELGLG